MACIICLEDGATQHTFSCMCTAMLHDTCLLTWYRHANAHVCPICRTTRQNQHIVVFNPMSAATQLYVWRVRPEERTPAQSRWRCLYMIPLAVAILALAVTPFILFYLALKYGW